MTLMVVKPLTTEANLSANTTVSNSQLVRIINTTTAVQVLTFGNGTSSNTTYANLTLLANSAIVVQKASLDILNAGNTSVLAVPIAWKG